MTDHHTCHPQCDCQPGTDAECDRDTEMCPRECSEGHTFEQPCVLATAQPEFKLGKPYIIPADSQVRFRQLFNEAMDAALRKMWTQFEDVLTTFPASEPPSDLARDGDGHALRERVALAIAGSRAWGHATDAHQDRRRAQADRALGVVGAANAQLRSELADMTAQRDKWRHHATMRTAERDTNRKLASQYEAKWSETAKECDRIAAEREASDVHADRLLAERDALKARIDGALREFDEHVGALVSIRSKLIEGLPQPADESSECADDCECCEQNRVHDPLGPAFGQQLPLFVYGDRVTAIVPGFADPIVGSYRQRCDDVYSIITADIDGDWWRVRTDSLRPAGGGE